MNKIDRFWSHDASNIRCVREADFDAVCAELAALKAEQPASGGAYSRDPLACSGCAAGCFRCRSSAGVVLPEPFQARVLPWLLECFGEVIASDVTERNHRFLEESLELVQACGCTPDEAHKLVDYVFGRRVGERAQEVGGVMVTLAALCLAQGLDMHQAGETELSRITQPAMVELIREKQKAKPALSPLPGVYPERLNPCRAQSDKGDSE